MFCPNCAEAHVNETTRFCTKCGFKLENLKSFVETGGELNSQISSRQKGIRRGIKLILLSVVLFPIYVFLAPMFPGHDRLVESSPDNTWFEQISWAIMTTLFVAGLLRIAYAYVFENSFSGQGGSFQSESESRKSLKKNKKQNALPPTQSTPVSNFGQWKETTDELFETVRRKERTSGELK